MLSADFSGVKGLVRATLFLTMHVSPIPCSMLFGLALRCSGLITPNDELCSTFHVKRHENA